MLYKIQEEVDCVNLGHCFIAETIHTGVPSVKVGRIAHETCFLIEINNINLWLMCFIKLELKHKVAKENITCYKIMTKTSDGKINSYHYPNSTGYNFGDSITPAVSGISFKILDSLDCLEREVVHAWISEPGSWLYDAYLQSNPWAAIVKCTIPKGTPYWESSACYASLNVVVEEVVKTIDNIV